LEVVFEDGFDCIAGGLNGLLHKRRFCLAELFEDEVFYVFWFSSRRLDSNANAEKVFGIDMLDNRFHALVAGRAAADGYFDSSDRQIDVVVNYHEVFCIWYLVFCIKGFYGRA